MGLVKRHSAVWEATQVAGEAKAKSTSKNASSYVKKSREVLEFKILKLQTELNLLDELSRENDKQKIQTVFSLLDKKKVGSVCAADIADGLRKVRGDFNFQRSIDSAIFAVSNSLGKYGDFKLDYPEFEMCFQKMAETMGCSYLDLSEMLVMNVVFSSSDANDDTGSLTSSNEGSDSNIGLDLGMEVQEEIKEQEHVQRLSHDTRMRALFGLFDTGHDGSVNFKEVVVGMYKITETIEGANKAAVEALMLCGNNTTRTLDFETFTRFIIHIVAASPDHVTFEDVADTMTRQVAQGTQLTTEQLNSMFALDNSMKRMQSVVNLKNATSSSNEIDNVSEDDIERIARLFELWDHDKDGQLNFHELALGLRKFEETTSLNTTVEESIKVMNAFDTNSDQKLDSKEFALFISRFAQTCGANLSGMIDFMIVTSALKDNKNSEQKYIQSLTSSDIYYWGS